MEDITKRVLLLENYKGNVVEEMKKHFTRIQEEEAQKKNLKEKILAEIAEEEKCCLVIGFPFTSMKKGEVLDGLIAAIMKEGICLDNIKVSVEIAWIKTADGEKRSLIYLLLGSKMKRDQFLANVNNNSLYRVRKTVPMIYRDPQKKLEQIAYTLRKTQPRLVATEFKFEGVMMNLVYKMRNTINDIYLSLIHI